MLAVAAIAALTGAPLARSAAVIAELEPDGSLAPVTDPVADLQDALRRGARRVILPVGGRMAAPAAGGSALDMVEVVRHAGGTAWLVPDLARAYRVVTSEPFPEPEAAEAAALALADDERGALDAAYRRALERIAPGWPHLLEQQNRARLPPPLAALLTGAERGVRRAERWRAAGDRAAAYVRLTEAAALADAASRLDHILRLVAEGDLSRARAELQRARESSDPVAWLPAGEDAPVTIGAHLRAASLFLAAADEWAWGEEAAARGRSARAALESPAGPERARLTSRAIASNVADGVAPLLVASALAGMHAERAEDRAALEQPAGPSFTANPDSLRALAAASSRAAAAALESLDRSSKLDHPASAPDTGSGSGSGSALSHDVVVARRLLGLVDDHGELNRVPGRTRVPDDRAPLLALVAAQAAFDRLGDAIARARRLGPELDPWTGQVLAVERPSGLSAALALAERAVRRQAASARVAIGWIPVGARIAYQAAAALARGDRSERVKALELYQAASAECRLAVLLALSESEGPRSAPAAAAARAGCRPSPSAPRGCR